MNYLLDVLEYHAHANTEHLPVNYCGDQDCYSPQYDTDSQHDPGDTSWVYTDASGEEISFDDFWGSNGGGGDSANPLRIAIPAFVGYLTRQGKAPGSVDAFIETLSGGPDGDPLLRKRPGRKSFSDVTLSGDAEHGHSHSHSHGSLTHTHPHTH